MVPPVVLGEASQTEGTGLRGAQLRLIWVSGRHWMDDASADDTPSYAMGEKFSGEFLFRVELVGGRRVDTELKALGDDLPGFFFRTEEIQVIAVDDYNGDGLPDFNILSRGCSWGDECYLFTILPSGKIQRLNVVFPSEDGTSGLGVEHDVEEVLSTQRFNLTPTGFYYVVHVKTPKEDVVEFLNWKSAEKAFVLKSQVIELR